MCYNFLTSVFFNRPSCLCRIWTRKGTQGNRWRYAQVDVYSTSVTRLRFEGVRGTSYRGDIAIDDVVVLDQPCPTAMYCDFEDTTLCQWSNQAGDNFDWTRASQGTPSLGTGPATDHTTGTSQGILIATACAILRHIPDNIMSFSRC